MLEHLGIRWGYVFLRSTSHVSMDELRALMLQAVEMYLNGEEQRKVHGDAFDGRLSTEQKYELLGEFGGQRFDADLETPYGHDQASFLVSEQTEGVASSISRISRN
ncbi:MAG: hypothetical protein EXR54_03085 [Dehalococcoidia bacterium]|nr:hypothetical protein [Dehalococcoidia bacterium]MSQ16540.1 hypothetical protein [Dehalococcoidia bacterium]